MRFVSVYYVSRSIGLAMEKLGKAPGGFKSDAPKLFLYGPG
jgi:hypothetical protein